MWPKIYDVCLWLISCKMLYYVIHHLLYSECMFWKIRQGTEMIVQSAQYSLVVLIATTGIIHSRPLPLFNSTTSVNSQHLCSPHSEFHIAGQSKQVFQFQWKKAFPLTHNSWVLQSCTGCTLPPEQCQFLQSRNIAWKHACQPNMSMLTMMPHVSMFPSSVFSPFHFSYPCTCPSLLSLVVVFASTTSSGISF